MPNTIKFPAVDYVPPLRDIDAYLVFRQDTPALDWPIAHGLNKHPSVSVCNSANDYVIGDVEYVDDNNVILHFTTAFAGTAYLN